MDLDKKQITLFRLLLDSSKKRQKSAVFQAV